MVKRAEGAVIVVGGTLQWEGFWEGGMEWREMEMIRGGDGGLLWWCWYFVLEKALKN